MECDCKIQYATPSDGYGFIYLYTFDNGQQYVGQTIAPMNIRHSNHKTGTQYVDKKIRTHKWNLRILGEYPESELDKTERFFIWLLDTKAPNGLNLDDGGYVKRNPSLETRQKQSIAHIGKEPWNKGKKFSEESCKRMSIAQQNRAPASEETRRKMSEAHRGCIPWCTGKKTGPHSEEWNNKISIAQKGRKQDPEHTKKIQGARRIYFSIRNFMKYLSKLEG